MIFYLLSIANACKLLTQNLNIYPTLDEQYTLPLEQIFNGNNLTYNCVLCPENVTIINSWNKIHNQDLNYTTTSLSSNNSHFVTFTNSNTINLYQYEKQNNSMQLLSISPINQELICFNSIFTYTNQILIDCYNNNQSILEFYYLNKSTMILMNQYVNQSLPNKTKILNFLSEDGYYLLYAQFYDDYQILTLFQFIEQQLINQTIWNQGIQDFDVSSSFIYILDANVIYQVYINENKKFQITSGYRVLFANSIQTHNFQFFSSQLDYFIVTQIIQSDDQYILNNFNFITFQAWNGSIIQIDTDYNDYNNLDLNTFVKSFTSEQFMVLQLNNSFTLNYIGLQNLPTDYSYEVISNSTYFPLCYLDGQQNYFFLFGDSIEIYQLEVPSLKIYKNKIQNQNFKIHASSGRKTNQYFECQLKIEYQIINSTDQSVYVAYNSQNLVTYAIYNTSFFYQLTYLTGPLLNATGVLQNSTLGSFKDATLQQLYIFKQQYIATSMFRLNNENNQIWNGLLFVGATTQEIYFYNCNLSLNCQLFFQESILSPINQIEITYCYLNNILVGVNQGINTVILYNITYNNPIFNVTKYQLLFPSYKQFLLTYNNIILLLLNNQILIQSLSSSDNLTISGKFINNLLSNYSLKQCNFTPQNIEMNSAELSSILYINNNNNFIILVIKNTKQIIPQSIIEVNYTIYQLNIINYQLIISYQCQQQICFQIWNVQNLINPQYIKDLPSLIMKQNWNIQSDNIFLYILNQNQTIYVLNPQLNYHTSLYFQFTYTGNYFTSFSMDTFSIISFGNSVYKLSSILLQQFKPQINSTTPLNYTTSTQFNFQINNFLLNTVSTQSQILSLVNPFTQIQFLQNSYNTSIQDKNFIIDLTSNNKIQYNGQILYYNITPNKLCKIQNYIQLFNISSSRMLCYQQFEYQNFIPQQLMILNNSLIFQYGALYYVPLYDNNNACEGWQYQYCFFFNFQYVQCLTTSYYGQSASQIFNVSSNSDTYYLVLIQNAINCTTIYCTCHNYTQFQVLTNFIFVWKMQSINVTNQIVLGLEMNDQYSSLYNFNTTQIKSKIRGNKLNVLCDTEIIDFTILNLLQYSDVNIILYICKNQLYYYQYSPIHNQKGQLLVDPQTYFFSDQIQLSQVLVLSQKYFSILLLLTSSNSVSIIFTAEYTYNLDNKDLNLFIQMVAQTIPPYGDFNLKQTYEQNGLVFMVFQKEKEVVYAIYDWVMEELQIQNPLVMKGGLNFSNSPLPNSIAMNISSSQVGVIYDYRNGALNVYNVSNYASLNCTLGRQKNINLILIAYNNFNSSSLPIEFIYVNQNDWFIGLIVFLAMVFLIAIFIYWYKTKGIKTHDIFFIDEVNMEL